MTHYDRLGVGPAATAAEIRDAWRRRAYLVHPDRHHGAPGDVRALATAEMAALNEAIATLTDPHRRARYDRVVAQPESRPTGHATSGPARTHAVYRDPRPGGRRAATPRPITAAERRGFLRRLRVR